MFMVSAKTMNYWMRRLTASEKKTDIHVDILNIRNILCNTDIQIKA